MRRLALPSLLVLALLGAAAPARAAFPGENGPLAVTAGRAIQCSRETGQYYRWQSYALRGRRVAPIALSQEYLSAQPAFSPDGIWIAAVVPLYDPVQGTNTLGIAVEYPDGVFSTWAVPPSTGDLGDPAWGPDAERVVFTRSVLSPYDKYGQAEIPWVTVVDSEGGPEHRIARGSAPSWSAADRIIYRGGKRGLFSISPTGRGRRHLTRGTTDDDPDWAPSGGSFAFSRRGAIWVGHAGRRSRQITHPPRGQEDTTPAFSPDGRRIAFIRERPRRTLCASHAGYLASVAARGGRVRRVLSPGRVRAGELADPSWSPAG